ncbi:MAG TPA: 2-phospho-L-lactate guanylyltransferase [Thermodesulfobacteriota bacterium]|nr:2-phospho-L-lactate guanylyltransferase [Thermodesulfobacteriota bacterium]
MRFALIPVKDLSKAKERLYPILSQSERTDLAYAMLEDVLIALRGSRLLDRILVVTLDENAIKLAVSLDLEVIKETKQNGESESVDLASTICKEMGAESVLVIPGDAPLITPEDVDFILEKEKPYHSVILVPARDELGTNAILRKPPDVIPSRFGYDSFNKHIEEARKRNIPYEIHKLPRVALDLDEPEDLSLFASQKSETTTYRELIRIGFIRGL